MYLSMTEDGKIYQSAQHRPDGLGFEKLPPLVSQGDTALGNANLNAEKDRQNEWNKLKKQNAVEALREENDAEKRYQAKRMWNRRIAYEQALFNSPQAQSKLKYEALKQQMHGPADFWNLRVAPGDTTPYGVEEPSLEQQARELAVLQGMGQAPTAEGEFIYDVADEEKEQWDLLAQYEAEKAKLNEIQAVASELVQKDVAVETELPPVYADEGAPTIQTLQTAQNAETGFKIDFEKIVTPKNLMWAGIAYLVLFRKK